MKISFLCLQGAVNLYTHAAIQDFLLRHSGSFTSAKINTCLFSIVNFRRREALKCKFFYNFKLFALNKQFIHLGNLPKLETTTCFTCITCITRHEVGKYIK